MTLRLLLHLLPLIGVLLRNTFWTRKATKATGPIVTHVLCDSSALIGVSPYIAYIASWLFLQLVLPIPFTYMDPSVVIGY